MKDKRYITDTMLAQFGRRMTAQERTTWIQALDTAGVYELVCKISSKKELDAYTLATQTAKCAVYVRMDPGKLQKTLRMGAQTIHLEVPAS